MNIIILTTDYNNPYLLMTINSLKQNGYTNIHIVKGLIRDFHTSKIVMDSWKKIFASNVMKQFLDDDLLIMEDDVIVKINKTDLLTAVWISKVNICFYQKKLVHGLPGVVGTQGIFIPKHLIQDYMKRLKYDDSIHFDNWNFRQDIVRLCGEPREYGVEIARTSNITIGKHRNSKQKLNPDIVNFKTDILKDVRILLC
tara:strand:- start:1681 stop:2274 length:594 start_codon:yes stop_codon:yes gene_type:complete